MRLDMGLIGGHVFARLRLAEKAKETFIIGQMARGRELEAAEREMSAVEVDRADARRVRREIGQDVAAARCDRHQMVARTDVERRHVDDRVLPDLRIDEAAESEGEEAFQEACTRECPASMHREVQLDRRLPPKSPCRLRHASSLILDAVSITYVSRMTVG